MHINIIVIFEGIPQMLLVEINNIITQSLFEAKHIRDYRHADFSKKLSIWYNKPSGSFVKTPGANYISTASGFHFLYRQGHLVLFSTNSEEYSGVVSQKLFDKDIDYIKNHRFSRKSDLFDLTKLNPPGVLSLEQIGAFGPVRGTVRFAEKTISMSFASPSNTNGFILRTYSDIKELKACFKDLMPFGVEEDFTIRYAAPPINGKTVKDILTLEDQSVEILKPGGQVMFHGTSLSRWEEHIKKKGLRPGNNNKWYADLIPNYSSANIYLAANSKTARFYGIRQAQKDNDSHYVVLQIIVPDGGKFLPDDAIIRTGQNQQSASALKQSISDTSQVAYRGNILPKFISLLYTKELPKIGKF